MLAVVRFNRPYGTRAIGSHFEPQDDVLGYVHTVPTARREAADSVTDPIRPGTSFKASINNANMISYEPELPEWLPGL